MNTPQQAPTFEQLQESLQTAINHPNDTGWMIYRYLKENLPTLSSEAARTLLATYTKLQLTTPSMLHSCILMIALKMSEKYNDFRLDSFLKIWGYPQKLRDEDKQKQVGKDGRTYLSLQERTERAVQSYLLHCPTRPDNNSNQTNSQEINTLGIDVPIRTMMAVKVFTTERNGRKLNSVKLIGADGQEMIAEQHQFPCKPWEIVGRMFDVLTRVSKNDNVRVQEMVVSQKSVGEVFPLTAGYIDRYDGQHNHYHVFDNMSRHFVAENPRVKPVVGAFVEFAPIIPAQDKFKVAVVTKVLSMPEGLNSFGVYEANVSYINKEKGYFYYKITSEIKPTPEGELTNEGSAQLSLIPNSVGEIQVGTKIQLVLFLARGKDGKKRNHVAKVIGC